MTTKEYINTDKAPKAIGPYSQAVKAGNIIYLSGQIPLNPITMELNNDSVESQAVQVFENLKAVIDAAGAKMTDIVKLNIYLSDMQHFATVNEVMARFCQEPYPARAALAVKELPKQVDVEIEGVVII
ncbi:MAG TPA: RidA family protein [Marinobacterium sp.]|nr:RidA family protein [Marinobacterium sp.]